MGESGPDGHSIQPSSEKCNKTCLKLHVSEHMWKDLELKVCALAFLQHLVKWFYTVVWAHDLCWSQTDRAKCN